MKGAHAASQAHDDPLVITAERVAREVTSMCWVFIMAVVLCAALWACMMLQQLGTPQKSENLRTKRHCFQLNALLYICHAADDAAAAASTSVCASGSITASNTPAKYM